MVKTLSLDQCFLSNLALNRRGEAVYTGLKQTILDAVRAGRLVCPAHVEETIFESSLLSRSEMDRIIAFQNAISYGLAFREFGELLALETLLLVRPTVEFAGLRFHPINISPSADISRLATANRSAKAAAVDRANRMPYPPQNHDPDDKLRDIFQKVSAERAGSMLRIVQSVLETRTINTGKGEWEYAVAVGNFLLDHQITNLEAHNLKSNILNHHWEMMPVLGFHTLLWSKVEQDMLNSKRAFKANDHVDILKLAVALNSADAIGCDTPMKDVVKQTKLNEGIRVFSIREADLLTDWIEAPS